MALILGVVLLLPALYAVSQAVGVYREQVRLQDQALRRLVGQILHAQGEILQQAQLRLEQMASRPELQAGSEPACRELLATEVARGGGFVGLAVLGATGLPRCAGGVLPAPEALGLTPWFKAVAAGASLAVSGPQRSAASSFPNLLLLVPLLGEAGPGAFLGVLSLRPLTAVPSTMELPQGTVVHLVDRSAVFVDAADPSRETLPGWAVIIDLLADPGSTAVVDGVAGRLRFISGTILPDRLYSIIGLPAPSWSWLERDLLVGIIAPVAMLALAVIGIWIAADYLVNRHIHSLAQAARAYAAGSLERWPELRGAPTELRELATVLARTSQTLGTREAELKASLAQKEVLLREIHHRVKNNLQVVTSLLNLRAQSAPSAEARLAMQEARSRIKALAMVHRELYEGDTVAAVDLHTLVAELCNLLENTVPDRTAEIEVRLRLEPVRLSVDGAVPIVLFVTEALSNAFRHAFPEGRGGQIMVGLRRRDGGMRLTIEDDGIGLGERRRRGLGLTLMRMLANQAGGQLIIDERPPGTRIGLDFPLAPTVAEARTV